MNRLRFSFLVCSLATAAFACGGISDPTRGGSENVATVSGALTGTAVPANARVALVYRKVTTTGTGSTATVEVASDAPVVGGKFTMNLGVPAADYFSGIEGHSIKNISDDSTPPSVGGGSVGTTPAPAEEPVPSGGSSGGGAFGVATKLAPRELVSGQITEPMTAAMAGFVVYADTNGNGKLDLEGEYASSPDEILGGNAELILVYLQGGGSLDYEKMRDKSGILPAAGFNLAWTEGRWLPLNVVELKLSSKTQLPSPVCASSSGYGSSGSGGSSGSSGSFEEAKPNTSLPPSTDAGAGPSGSSSSGGGGGTGYPSPTDPSLQCSPDGRSYTYYAGSECPPPPPAPVGLCAGSGYDVAYPCARAGYTSSLMPGEPVPSGWPCTTDLDGGSFDGGSSDASFDSGIGDAGAGPG